MEQGLDFGMLLNNQESIGQIKVKAFDLTTDPCLPKPKSTDKSMIGWIIFINLFCFLTCLIEAYTCRWRSQICNMFYPNRANSRAMYLYKKIFTGRSRRRLEIRQIGIKEKTKQEKLEKLTLTPKISTFLHKRYEKFTIFLYPKLHLKIQTIFRTINSNYGKETIYCHGCNSYEAKESSEQKSFKDNLGENIDITLCEDCLKEC